MMQIVPQILSTSMASMTIVDTEEGALRPVLILPVIRLDNVQNDGDSVFIVCSDETLVGIGSICSDNPVPLQTALCRLMVGDDYPAARLQRELLGFIIFIAIVDHLVNILCCEYLSLRACQRVKLLGHIKTRLVSFEECLQSLLTIGQRLSYLV
jgi:hypothetical protein